MQGEMQPTIYRFKLGGFEVATIMDSKEIRSGLSPSFGGEAAANEVKALAAANRIEADRYEHPFTPTVVNTGKQLVLFDTGNGSLRDEHEQLKGRLPPGNLVARMAQAGYKPEDVDVVVITHGHPDHIGGLTKGGQLVFPNARYVFGAAEFDFWNKGETVRAARKFNRELYVKIVVPLANRATMIKPGDVVVPGITAVDAAGHSPGMLLNDASSLAAASASGSVQKPSLATVSAKLLTVIVTARAGRTDPQHSARTATQKTPRAGPTFTTGCRSARQSMAGSTGKEHSVPIIRRAFSIFQACNAPSVHLRLKPPGTCPGGPEFVKTNMTQRTPRAAAISAYRGGPKSERVGGGI